jgi:hypothetical protein
MMVIGARDVSMVHLSRDTLRTIHIMRSLTSPDLVRTSKFLSLTLRQRTERIGLALNAQGWANVDDLIRPANQHGVPLTRPLFERSGGDTASLRRSSCAPPKWQRQVTASTCPLTASGRLNMYRRS